MFFSLLTKQAVQHKPGNGFWAAPGIRACAHERGVCAGAAGQRRDGACTGRQHLAAGLARGGPGLARRVPQRHLPHLHRPPGGGRVRYGVAWPGLLAEEKVADAVLPCVAYPLEDVRLEPPRD